MGLLDQIQSDGAIEHHKSRLVLKGFSQQEGINYTDTFIPVSKMNSIRLIISLVAFFGWSIHHMDVKSAFLHGDPVEKIYMEPPPGFVTGPTIVCHLKKYLYRLK